MKRLGLFSLSLLLSGCATASFSPPSVDLENELAVRGSNSSWGARCMPTERLTSQKQTIAIKKTVAGTQALINNFVYMYRCRAHSAANGRQIFEIPTLLTAAGSATAMAFGAPPEVAIAGGAATATLGAGKNYYDPQTKAAIFDSALNALLCIKNESLGLDPITLDSISKAESQGAKALANPGVVSISAEERYFEAVSSALFSVERVLAQRLSRAGIFDPAGVIAEIKTLSDEARAKQSAAQAGAQGQATAILSDGSQGALSAQKAASSVSVAKVTDTLIQLETLQPKLQQCVVTAKI